MTLSVTFKNQCSVHFGLCVPIHPPAKSPKDPEVTGPKFTKFVRRRKMIVDVKATFAIAIFTLDVGCQRTE